MACICQNCNTPYTVDLLVPDSLWEQIKPDGKPVGGGLLCSNCILHRASMVGEYPAGYVTAINGDYGKITFEEKYDGESIVDVSRDVWESFDSRFNPIMETVAEDDGFYQGTFIVTVRHLND